MKENAIVLCKSKDGQEILKKEESRYLGTLIIGPAGSGKTQGVLIPLVRQDIENGVGGITIFDKDGTLSDAVYVYARGSRKKVYYTNPSIEDVRFNPIKGNENEVIDGLVFAFKKENSNSPQFFIDMGIELISNGVKVIKRLKGEEATLMDLSTLFHNSQGQGKVMISSFAKLDSDSDETTKENIEIASWFLNDYFNEKTKTYEHTAIVRTMLYKVLSNENARKLLNTEEENVKEINFDKHIKNKEIVIINLNSIHYGATSEILETLFFESYRSAIFRQNKERSIPNYLYIDGNCSFCHLLSQFILNSRPYKVGTYLSTKNLSLLREENKDLFLSNMRNLILMPGLSLSDAKFFTETFIEKFSFSDVFYMNFGEVLYSIIDNDTHGCRNVDIGLTNFLKDEEKEFIARRILAYKKQFEIIS